MAVPDKAKGIFVVVVGYAPACVEAFVEVCLPILVGVDQLGDLRALNDVGLAALWIDPDAQSLMQSVGKEGPLLVFGEYFHTSPSRVQMKRFPSGANSMPPTPREVPSGV